MKTSSTPPDSPPDSPARPNHTELKAKPTNQPRKKDKEGGNRDKEVRPQTDKNKANAMSGGMWRNVATAAPTEAK